MIPPECMQSVAVIMYKFSTNGILLALLGDPKSLTVPEVIESLSSLNLSRFTEKEASVEQHTKLYVIRYSIASTMLHFWIPKCRRKILYGRIRQHLGEVIRDLAWQRESLVLEGHAQVAAFRRARGLSQPLYM